MDIPAFYDQYRRFIYGAVFLLLVAVLVTIITLRQESVDLSSTIITEDEVASSTADFMATSSTTITTATTAEVVTLEPAAVVPSEPISVTAPPQAAPPVVTPPVVEEVAIEPELEPEPETPASVTALSSQERATLLTSHNAVRTQKGLQPLTWSPTVAASAARWADYLATQDCSLVHSDSPYGENLYYEWTTASNITRNPGGAVFWWLDEEQYYDYEDNSCAPGEQCGHYTQAVWKETTQLGCAVSFCNSGGRKTQMWVCQYNPPGNDGTRPY